LARAVLGDAGMNAGGQAVFGGQTAEEGDELFALGGIEARAQLGLMVGRGLHDLPEYATSFTGEVQGAYSAVGRNGPPLEQAALLEPVDEGDHAARRDLERLRQRLLGLPLCRRNVSKQHDFARIEVQTSHSFPPEARGVEADLGEQEGGAGHTQAIGALIRCVAISQQEKRT
jgi:hypothetical protein